MAAGGILSQHQAQLSQGHFLIQHCNACDKHIYFPREICPHCGAADPVWATPSGHGTVYAVTTVRRKAEAGGDYNVSLIDLDEGVRLMSRVTLQPPDAVRIGLRVMARVQVIDGVGLVLFDPQPESQRSAS
jgi:uncharacterized OB-fold protein